MEQAKLNENNFAMEAKIYPRKAFNHGMTALYCSADGGSGFKLIAPTVCNNEVEIYCPKNISENL